MLIGFKPALDAYRVASGAEQEKGQILDPVTEMTCMKGIEMFAESIPGGEGGEERRAKRAAERVYRICTL